MALNSEDRKLLAQLLTGDGQAWREFVDRFLGVIYHTIRHTAHLRSHPLDSHECDDLAADIMKRLLDNDYRILRSFRGEASLATFLVVIARRITVNHMARKLAIKRLHRLRELTGPHQSETDTPPDVQIEVNDEVAHLLKGLNEYEAKLVRGIYLEHKTYKQLSEELGIPENSVGPMLSRLRSRLKERNREALEQMESGKT